MHIAASFVLRVARGGIHRERFLVSGRLLLRDAVQRAEAPDPVIAVDRDHLPPGKAGADDFTRLSVAAWLPKRRHQYGTVDDQEISVAGRNALALKRERFRHGHFDNLEFLALRRSKSAQPLAVCLEDSVVGVA